MPVIQLISSTEELLEQESGTYSFLNLYSIGSILDSNEAYPFQYSIDGALLCLLVKWLYGIKVQRISFDFTSLARPVFEDAINKNKRIALVGGKEEELTGFIKVVKSFYPALDICFSQHGYFEQREKKPLVEKLVNLNPDIILLSLGSDYQDSFALDLIQAAYQGKTFTCGAFFSQTATSMNIDYYPWFFRKTGLRFVYRMYKEPHTRKRYMRNYPVNTIKLVLNCFYKNILFELVYPRQL